MVQQLYLNETVIKRGDNLKVAAKMLIPSVTLTQIVMPRYWMMEAENTRAGRI